MHYISPGKLVPSPRGGGGCSRSWSWSHFRPPASIVSPFNHLYLQFARLANLKILQVYFDVWRVILLLLRNSAYSICKGRARGSIQFTEFRNKKVTKINQKHTIFKNYFCNPECSETRLEQCTIVKNIWAQGRI